MEPEELESEIMFVQPDGTPLQPEPGPIWLESYEYGERMLVPGWITHVGYYNGMPHIRQDRLQGPGVPHLGWLSDGNPCIRSPFAAE